MLMVSLSIPVRRMRLKASSTVMSRFRSTNSVVMMDPAESSGYFNISLTLLRVSGSVCLRIRLTTEAGISSMRSTVSSTYSSSSTSFSSVSEKVLMSSSWTSGSISTNTSAAVSLGSSRYSSGMTSGPASSRIWAISALSMGRNMSRRSA